MSNFSEQVAFAIGEDYRMDYIKQFAESEDYSIREFGDKGELGKEIIMLDANKCDETHIFVLSCTSKLPSEKEFHPEYRYLHEG